MLRFALAAALLGGCGARIGSKDVDVVQTTRVSSQSSVAALSGGSVNAAFSQQGVDPTHIASARLVAFTLTAPGGGDLSFFQSGTLAIKTSEADKTVIATVDAFPAGQSSVPFTIVPDVELKPFVTAPQYQVAPEVTFARSPPFSGVDVEAKAVIRVEFQL